MTYEMHVAAPTHKVYTTLQALENLIKEINDTQGHDQYDSIVSAFPLGNIAVVITEKRYTR